MKALALAAILALTATSGQETVVIDHLILGINDLDRGVAEFERLTGVRPVIGGVHPGRGTQNALASLGDGHYIEVIAPDPKQSVSNPMLAELKPLEKLTPLGWAIGASDLFALQARLQGREIEHSAPRPNSRALPDGSTLQWTAFSITKPAHDWMPFFIRWADASRHPSVTAPAGCRLESVQIEDPNVDPLIHVFSTIRLKVPLSKSDASRMTIALHCPKGRVTFR